MLRNFYVDNGIASRPTEDKAIALLRNFQAMLATANIRRHTVVSNLVAVLKALPVEDRAKSSTDPDLRRDILSIQRSKGVHWDIQKDRFTFRVSLQEKPFTLRGVLSVVNSVCDPLGLVCPVILEGKPILQELVTMGKKASGSDHLGWDDPLPKNMDRLWSRWRHALPHLEDVSVPRCYHPEGFGHIIRREIHTFSGAIKEAISTVVYLREISNGGNVRA